MADYYHSLDRKEIEGVPLGEIGFSTAPMKDQLDELKAKIRAGVSKVELGFWGKGKGYGENFTPGTYGAEQRKAIKDFAKVNRVELSTHATPNVGPISGFTQQGFKEESRKESVDEIKRAIDFAADVTEGGPVVMHTGEFVRPIFDAGQRIEGKDKKNKFQGYRYHGETDKDGNLIQQTEEDQATMYLADELTGQIIDSVKKDQPIFLPIYEKDDDGNIVFEKEENGNGDKLVPKIKEKPNGEAEIKQYDWQDIEKLKDQSNKKNGTNYGTQEWYFQQKIEEKMNEMEGSKAYYQELLDEKSQFNVSDERRKGLKKSIMATDQRIEEMKLMRSHAKPIEKVAIAKSAESLADLGLHAMAKQKSAKLKKDLYVSPENIFPEQYGGHPDELKKMVQEGRARMVDKLKDKGWGKERATEEAEKHIKATFDIGHANTWRRYFKGSDKEFQGWLMDKVKDLKKSNVLGHVHVSDNFGYYDEHVDPGQGTAPIKEAIEKLKGEGVDFVVETGRQGERALLSAFKEFGSPIYGLRTGQFDPWDVVENSYFGRTSPPYFLVGEVTQQMGERVSKDFSSWAGIPFE
ncbi:hypothetical protein HN592_04155 [Candidatus Woesearchaeota archaeon]|jgi:sugar phosphate isomerase/epimerase|nr:hypothetical protein [Candidatus Woesearchaeota archaeon]MBT4368405.1 hypothetical protein [Candidatus Woesearchaeota archaeon]MBT4712894.1 hypothetical protein [Candidatus Woesearchaeota archaeon]MBT6639806.1 hypothetical protein [Candidatus Woesearchaeota archaeon]MBT7133978.1 hypothetical protein [Candidatus Woesearchaeota archaeon]